MTVEEEDTRGNIIREGVIHDRNFVFANRVVNKFCNLRKATYGLDGQHQDVDRTLRGRVSQNERGQG